MISLGGDDRDGLDTRCAGTDDAHPLSGEIDGLMRPLSGMEQLSCEAVGALDLREIGIRETSHRGDHPPRPAGLTGLRSHRPGLLRVIESDARNPGVEREVFEDVHAVSGMVQVAQDLGLARISLLKRPLLLHILEERIRVVHGLGVAARPWIPVPVPRAAHAITGLKAVHGKTGLAQPVHHVHAGKPRSDHHRVEGLVRRLVASDMLQVRHVSSLPDQPTSSPSLRTLRVQNIRCSTASVAKSLRP